MNIAIVYHYDPLDKGNSGVLRHISNLLANLASRGIKVTLIGIRRFDEEINVDNIRFIPIIKGDNRGPKFLLYLIAKLPFLAISPDMIVHVHHPLYIIPFLIWKKKNPIILTLHWERRVIYNRFYHYFESIALKRANKIVATSDRAIKSFPTINRYNPDKISLIPIGISSSHFKILNKMEMRAKYRIDCNSLVILFVGVLEEIKNLALLVRAFKIINQIYDNSLLILVGNGPQKNILKILSRDLGIENKVEFLGQIPYEKIPEIYNCADIFALTSKSESSPTVIREALACGIPVVSTDVGDVSEIITDSQIGCIVKYPNEEEFADELLLFWEHVKKNPEIRKRCIDKAKEFSDEIMIDKYIEVYSNAKY
jgi:L-malate glycosyltransferase